MADFDWNLGPNGRIEIVQLATNQRLEVSLRLNAAVTLGLKSLQGLCCGERADIFRDIEYRALRDVLLKRIWEMESKHQTHLI